VKRLTVVDDHPQLPLARKPEAAIVSTEIVRAQKTVEAAVALAIQVSGLPACEVAIACGIDKGHFSRMLDGDAHFPLNKLRKFCDVVGNTILPEWIAYQVDSGLVLLRTEAERRADAAEQALADAQKENSLLRNLLQGRASA